MKIICTDVDGSEIDIGNDKDKLRNCLSFMYGRINAFSEIQAYVEREISETSEEIGRIKSLLNSQNDKV